MENVFVVQTKGLTKEYSGQKIIEDINLHIPKGKIYGLLGRNGAGKTTIMKMMLNLTSITSGDIYMFSKSVKTDGNDIYPRVGSLIEAPGFYPNLTGYENLKVFAKLKGTTKKNAVEDALDLVNLPKRDKKTFAGYSLGMKQRLALANALMNEPEFILLDEPTNGLDPIGIAELRSFIKDLSQKEGKTILLSSHQLNEVEQLADTIGVLHNKKLLEECSMEDIAKYNHQYINLEVSDINKASMLLEEKLNIKNFKAMNQNTLHVFEFSKEPYLINRTLLENGVDVSLLATVSANLEEHFKLITGGVGID